MDTNQSESFLSIPIASKVFSPTLLTQLAKTGRSRLLTSVVSESGFDKLCEANDSLSNCFDLIYSELQSSYRNEYIYKNAIANKILLGRHSLNTATMHTEFRVGESKADILILNGTSHIYEIKTELDSLERLSKQLDDYLKFSEYVTIVTADRHVEKLLQRAPSAVGILILTGRGSLKTIRKANSGKNNLVNSLIFDSLQKSEYTKIIYEISGFLPDVSNALMYTECKKVFEQFDINDCHHLIVDGLKSRNMDNKTKEFIMSVPECLKAAATAIKLTKAQRTTLLDVLRKRISDCIYHSSE